MPELPSGTVTFLYTDIEGSTRRWEQCPAAMRAAVERHFALLREAIGAHGGHVFRTQGDGLCAAFATAPQALAAALAAQLALHTEPWPADAALRVRMALHTGAAEVEAGDYVGACMNRIGRLHAIGHGGQTLLSRTTYDLVREALPAGSGLRDLGEHRLRDLATPEQVFQLLHPELPADFPPLQSLDVPRHNLPVELTSFVGRDHELAEVRRLLNEARLVTLTGVGGIGKTRLAIEVARSILDAYPDGVWLVELAALGQPELVPQVVAFTLGLRDEPGHPILETLIAAVGTRRMLIVLDNCEHLVHACAQLAETLLRSCPNLRLLVTNREALNLPGETTWRVPSLGTADPQHPALVETLLQLDAVQLFVDRARAVEPGFTVTRENAPALATICYQVDGIPLAIELAAARVRVLTVEQIAEHLSDCFRLLTGGARTALPRQQTLRATVDWSYNFLSEQEKRLLRRASVFAGGWTLEAAEAVCAGDGIQAVQVLDLLTRLVEKSLVLTDELHGRVRFRLLETIRRYGAAKLGACGEADTVERAHAAYFLQMVEATDVTRAQRWGRHWWEPIDPEYDNIRAVLGRARDQGDPDEIGLRLVGAFLLCWLRISWSEALDWARAFLALSAQRPPTAARLDALWTAGIFATYLGDLSASASAADEAQALASHIGSTIGLAYASILRGLVANHQADFARSEPFAEETVRLVQGAEAGGEGTRPWITAAAKAFFAEALVYQQRFAESRVLFDEATAQARDIGEFTLLGAVRFMAGMGAMLQGDLAEATVALAEGANAYRETGGPVLSTSLIGLGEIALRTGDANGAARHLREALGSAQAIGYRRNIPEVLLDLGLLARVVGQPERSARLFGAAEALRCALKLQISVRQRESYEETVNAVRTALGHSRFRQAWAAGQAMTPDQAITYALGADDEAASRARA